MFKKTHNVQKLKADILVLQNEHRSEREDLRKTQRALSELDKDPKADWQQRYKLCDRIGSLLRSTSSRKDELTVLYQARAALRGRLHMSKRIIHHSNGTKETEAWTVESQRKAVEHVLEGYALPEEAAGDVATKPAA